MEDIENDSQDASREVTNQTELQQIICIVDADAKSSDKSFETLNKGNTELLTKQAHANSLKRKKNSYKCSKCSSHPTFSSSNALTRHHSASHVQEIQHECHNCGHHFKQTIESAKSSRTVYTQTGLDYYICELCCKRLDSFDEVEQHKLSHHKKNSKVGTPQDRFICQYCNKTFQFRGVLLNHILIHTGDKPHTCPYCSKTFRRKGQLDVHVNIHTKQTIYMCGECDARFYQATTLHHHLRSKHQEWGHECQFCGKRHVSKRDKEEHERIHTGEKPYTCEHCGIGFPRKQNLDNHLKAHRNERSFACTKCAKSFFRKSTLKEHFRTHTGEKPYQCQRCKKRFTQKSHLRGHLRSHLRQELEKHQPVGVEIVTPDTVDNTQTKVDHTEVNLPVSNNDSILEPAVLIINTSSNDLEPVNESKEWSENKGGCVENQGGK